MIQPDLFSQTPEYVGTIDNAIDRCAEADRTKGGGRASDTAWAAFKEYHKERPEVFTAFRKATEALIEAGCKHFGSMDIVGKIRWEAARVNAPEGEYKIGNTAHPFYARLFMEFQAQHKGFFEIKSRPLTGIVKSIKETA